MKAHYDKQKDAPIKMIRPNESDMPKHVVQGKYFPYKKLAAVHKKGAPSAVDKQYRKAGDPLAGIAGMDMTSKPPVDRVTTVDPNEAAQFHRNPDWKHNGPAVRSCKEYAYARSYSAVRFIDAASACRGDRECVFDVAYMNGSPGIAKRQLFDEAGVLMARQLDVPKQTKAPKNDMFVAGVDEFIKVKSQTFPNGMTVQDAEAAALKSALRSGSQYYEIGYCSGGGCNTTRKFADVWDWHKRLHDVTVALSQAEAEEYERRRARFRALLEQWGAAVNREKSMGEGFILEQPVVLPFDMRAYDPFERYELEHTYIERGRDARTRFKQRFGPDILAIPRAQAVQKIQQKLHQQGSLQPDSATMAVGLLAAPAPASPKAKATPAGRAAPTTPLPNVDPASWLSDGSISRCLSTTGWGLEMAYQGPISCRIEEFLIGEWRRKADGHKSCLDLGNPGCDWTPQMFEAGILDQFQKLDVQVSDEAHCKSFSEPNTFVDNPNNGGVSTVTAVKTRLDVTRAIVEQQLKALAPYRRTRTANHKGRPLGKTWEGGDVSGDKNWFAAGYEWEVGWDVVPTEQKDDVVCRLEGSAHGEMAFDAYIIGGKIPVVAGSVWAEAKTLSGNDLGKARFNAHLEMMGQSVFNTDGWKAAMTYEPDEGVGFGVKVPPGLKPRFDVYVGVPVSGQMWGELLFGSTLGLGGASSEGCDKGNPQFAIEARYMPFFGAFGVGQVGVGIAGVASAGIRAAITLIMLGMPADFGMQVAVKDNSPTLSFSAELGLLLATLGGRVSLYVEFLGFDEEFELFRWKGFSTKVPLMPKLTADVQLVGLK
jgi:hypothetical protein